MSVQLKIKNALDCLYDLSTHIVNGASLEGSLDYIFETFKEHIPYDRIGFAEVDMVEHTATAIWARSKKRSYCAPAS